MQHLQLDEETRPPASLRERELEVGRLVLRAMGHRNDFVVRRAAAAVADLDASAARRALRRVVAALLEGDAEAARTALPAYGAALEQHGLHAAAGEVYEELVRQKPLDAAATLHAARAARRAGRREDALRLYRRAGEQSAGDAHMSLVVRIGEALVSDTPYAELTQVIRSARCAGDRDAQAIAREERARLGAPASGAAGLRDLAMAAARYRDRTDRVRVLHRLAELLAARGDLAGAREALLAAMDQVPAAQRGHTVQRLRTVARSLGDELELRRTRGRAAAGPVMLAPSRRAAPGQGSVAPRLRRLRSLLPEPCPN